jgi:O-antigen/teichoic acid export membrane protein
MLGTLAGALQAGHYGAVLKVAAFLAIVRVRLAVVTSHLIPPLFEQRDFAAIQNTCRAVAAVGVTVSFIFLAISLVWGADILTALYGPEFAVAAPVLSMIILAFTVSSAAGMVGGVFIMTGHQSINFKVSCISAAINVLLNPPAIYLFGALGAAGTLLASTTAYFVIMTIIMRRKFGIDVSILGYIRKPIDPDPVFIGRPSDTQSA